MRCLYANGCSNSKINSDSNNNNKKQNRMATHIIVKGAATQKLISTYCWSSMILMALSTSSYKTAWLYGSLRCLCGSVCCLSCGKRSPAAFWYAVAAIIVSTTAKKQRHMAAQIILKGAAKHRRF